MREITVFTHGRPEEIRVALDELIGASAEAGVRLRFDVEETSKLGLAPLPSLVLDAEIKRDVELCIVLGGDGTILRALRHYAGTSVPVFAINFGAIGFLATVEPENLADGIRRALHGDYELLRLPAITLDLGSGSLIAVNDVAIHRKVGERVAELSYSLDGEEAGNVRCDGLVVATPAGSTGYNLANGGPVMAWGVEGFVVSFIAPHSMTARALVVAPGDRLCITNRSREPLDVAVDGRPVGEIHPDGLIEARFAKDLGTLAQLPGTSFYRRLREKFGRLAS
ncbi:MAG: kinase [Solirubrobacterales bacterium]|nr:kinase [Solirubrobacterales bacterium]